MLEFAKAVRSFSAIHGAATVRADLDCIFKGLGFSRPYALFAWYTALLINMALDVLRFLNELPAAVRWVFYIVGIVSALYHSFERSSRPEATARERITKGETASALCMLVVAHLAMAQAAASAGHL